MAPAGDASGWGRRNAKQTAVHAAREGARIGATGIADGGNKNATCTAFATLVKKRASGISLDGVEAGFGDNGSSGQAGNVLYGTLYVKVKYTVNLGAIAWLPGIPAQLHLSEVAKSAIEKASPTNIGAGCP